jgi:hypothetical protein
VYAIAGGRIRDGRFEVSAWCSSSRFSMIYNPRSKEKPGPEKLAVHDFAEKR